MLPPGIHDATLLQVDDRFATNSHRKHLFDGFRRAAEALRAAGCATVYLDGSFVTDKPTPADFDACWDDSGLDVNQLDKVLLDFTNKRQAQKKKYLGELFPARNAAASGIAFLDFFQADRHTGKRKGILRIGL